ncbi:hypothetical protein FNT36_06935 [Hymenobacter setariae]|uniref:Bacteriocin-protection protein n=1 Tax=Hymenobacter setariae TaxID=2594794 RepID=A0A558BXE3_9BACT|nr:YdeI/OmpD-associated family protein [Hymenobacter setariae]TVT41190.1 hypothetical protein FNT36_06935 [Hymenobacter setariae]
MKLTRQPTTFCPSSPQHWREWLQAHHATEQAVWLIYYKKAANQPSLTWSQAVDEALCFGWIDSQAKPLDGERYQQYFSRRKPTSGWSRVNKDKVARLLAEGRMTPYGLASIEVAQQNGSWSLLDEATALVLPADLALALESVPAAHRYFLSLSKSVRQNVLQWVALAKRPATRQQRIAEIVESAAQQLRPKPFRR